MNYKLMLLLCATMNYAYAGGEKNHMQAIKQKMNAIHDNVHECLALAQQYKDQDPQHVKEMLQGAIQAIEKLNNAIEQDFLNNDASE